ncbi:MAG: hypothetical protein ACOX3W_00540 [Christensenellaceae bacterium]
MSKEIHEFCTKIILEMMNDAEYGKDCYTQGEIVAMQERLKNEKIHSSGI